MSLRVPPVSTKRWRGSKSIYSVIGWHCCRHCFLRVVSSSWCVQGPAVGTMIPRHCAPRPPPEPPPSRVLALYVSCACSGLLIIMDSIRNILFLLLFLHSSLASPSSTGVCPCGYQQERQGNQKKTASADRIDRQALPTILSPDFLEKRGLDVIVSPSLSYPLAPFVFTSLVHGCVRLPPLAEIVGRLASSTPSTRNSWTIR